jgi:hypothetical protein
MVAAMAVVTSVAIISAVVDATSAVSVAVFTAGASVATADIGSTEDRCIMDTPRAAAASYGHITVRAASAASTIGVSTIAGSSIENR